MRLNRNLGMTLLGIWLILTGLTAFVGLGIPAPVTGAIAIAAGALILIGR